ncbi:hypothetical protein LEP1GSC050_3482 [Leptospira broomii serovar Hurstbridge str. 5399]|uniref:Uncharacterized protein n=1 Tax=Leptospira broomii serovar Hurstbridge str. 5399 TaxID=1049789 RepID=T0F3Y7_9LEPT|nr:hypothetical protein LEP1GSC050_3482 [Leptospira broomii serovar Hurstbridge str. 5399]
MGEGFLSKDGKTDLLSLSPEKGRTEAIYDIFGNGSGSPEFLCQNRQNLRQSNQRYSLTRLRLKGW